MGLYLGALLVSVGGLVTLDFRLRLFLFDVPWRAATVLVLGVIGFLAWDAAGVGLGIFFEGASGLLVGVDLAPEIPLEELVFLILLCLTAMHAFLLAQRLLAPSPGPWWSRVLPPGRRVPRSEG